MNNQTAVHPYDEILPSNKKEQTLNTCSNKNESQMRYAKQKKSVLEGYILQHFIDMTFLEKVKLQERRTNEGLQVK